MDISKYSPGVQDTLKAYGANHGDFRRAHKDSNGFVGPVGGLILSREIREERLENVLSEGATRSFGAGNRPDAEAPDPYRTAFERDLDRIRYASAFRRLSGKCQVFLAPRDDMLRNRMTHAQEVAQVALSIGRALGLSLSLIEAIGLGHDCGHGPGGHASEDAFTPFIEGGYDHAIWGADVTLKPLNLTLEVSNGIRNHSWRLPAPTTPEAEVVSWADRIAYVCHDFDDAQRAGVLALGDLPGLVKDAAGVKQSSQLDFFISSMIASIESTGHVSMHESAVEVLDVFRKFNYERIYLRPASQSQAVKVIHLLTQLVEYYSDAPGKIPELEKLNIALPRSGSAEAAWFAVEHVSKMTDRYALNLGVELLGWRSSDLPLAA